MMPNPLSGSMLWSLYQDDKDYRTLNGFLPESPEASLKKITEYYNVLPSVSGHNIADIETFRNSLYGLDAERKFANALMIVAPHTHWEENIPIIIEKEQEKYCIGQKRPDSNSIYLPVSFFIKDNRILAYEWAAPSVGLNSQHVKQCYECILNIMTLTGYTKPYLGLSINFRFKELFDRAVHPTIENPSDDSLFGFDDMSVIELSTSKPNTTSVSQQVSWHMYSDLDYGLNEDELQILNLFRDLDPGL